MFKLTVSADHHDFDEEYKFIRLEYEPVCALIYGILKDIHNDSKSSYLRSMAEKSNYKEIANNLFLFDSYTDSGFTFNLKELTDKE